MADTAARAPTRVVKYGTPFKRAALLAHVSLECGLPVVSAEYEVDFTVLNGNHCMLAAFILLLTVSMMTPHHGGNRSCPRCPQVRSQGQPVAAQR